MWVEPSRRNSTSRAESLKSGEENDVLTPYVFYKKIHMYGKINDSATISHNHSLYFK